MVNSSFFDEKELAVLIEILVTEQQRTESYPGVCDKCQGEIIVRRNITNRGMYYSHIHCGNCGLGYPKAKSYTLIGMSIKKWNELLNTPFTI